MHHPSRVDLLLHIGLAKTATSTIQSELLDNHPGFLGKNWVKYPPKYGDSDLVSRLQTILTQVHLLPRQTVIEQTKKWISDVLQIHQSSKTRSLILSDENLMHWPVDIRNQHNRHPIRHSPQRWRQAPSRSRPSPCSIFLHEILVPLWENIGSVKVLLVLRSQADWLASLYAQRSNCIWFPSQKDFENQIKMIAKSNETYINWYSLVIEFERAVGRSNLEVLFYEEIGEIEFWERIGRYFEFEPIDWSVFINGKKAVNVRHDGINSWNLRPLNSLHLLYQAYTQHWDVQTRQYFYHATNHLFRGFFDPVMNGFRSSKLYLDDNTRESIRDLCKESNIKLSDYLNRDLSKLGY